ncbi:MAG: type II toxin-antitoxin system RelE/ParE family toxin [Bacteroidia bacterium]|nr:type II toxin-antitoxin system RelE/ParE family toxin [Bacteroidia bacterium]
MQEIKVEFLKEAEDFLDEVNPKARKKIFSDISKTRAGLRGEWFCKMPGTDDIWEFRTLFNKTYYRVFAFWHKRGEQETLVICTNGIVKTTAKTPRGDIERAERIKKEYMEGS